MVKFKRKAPKGKKLKMTSYSKQLLGWGSIISAIIYSIGLWLNINLSFIPAGILLIILGLILIIETMFEGETVLDFGDIINVFIGLTSITLGLLNISNIGLPEFLLSIQGFLYLILALAIGIEMYR